MQTTQLTKSQEVFGTTPKSIIKKILERVTKEFPKDEIYKLYNQGKEGDKKSTERARDMFGKALGKYLGETDFLPTGLCNNDMYLDYFTAIYNIEGLDSKKFLDFLYAGGGKYNDPQLMADFRFLINHERCPLFKYTIARLIQSFDAEFIMPPVSLSPGYNISIEAQKILAITNEAGKKDEHIEEIKIKDEETTIQQVGETSTTKDNSPVTPNKSKSFLQSKKDKKTLAYATAMIGICSGCSGLMLNSENKKKALALKVCGAVFGAATIYISGVLSPRRPKIKYIGRKFTLDENYLATYICKTRDGRIDLDNKTEDYENILNIFHNRLKLILDGTHPRLDVMFPKKEDRELYLTIARAYIKTSYSILEEFPNILESIVKGKNEWAKDYYLTDVLIKPSPFTELDGKVFLDTNPQPWGPGVKPDDWREGDGIVEEEEIPESTLNLSGRPVCMCPEPKQAV